MIAVSAPLLLAYSLVLSVVLWLSRSFGWSVPATLVMSLSLSSLPLAGLLLITGRSSPEFFGRDHWTVLRLWLTLVLVPTMAVWLISRLSAFASRPWMLLIVAPLCFAVTSLVLIVLHNVTVQR